MDRDYTECLNYISDLIKLTYKAVISSVFKKSYSKSEYDEVTDIDYCIERELISGIKEYMPGALFLSEEFNSESALKDNTWIIDPIDGTCNFTHGIDLYGVQCALFDKGDIRISALYFPFSDELYTAEKGAGAWLNDEKLQCIERDVNRSIISFGDFVHDDLHKMELEHIIMKHVSKTVERIRMFGSASIDLAYAAKGRIDGNYTFVKNQWDIAPGILLCREAGLLVTDAFGNPYTTNSDTLAVFSGKHLMEACVSGYKAE